jgi:FkbM family methyltransferase
MEEGTTTIPTEPALVPAAVEGGEPQRVAPVWLVWNALPRPVQAPSRALIALGRRLAAHRTALPVGPPPALPDEAVELRTRYGSFWFDSTDTKLTPWVRRHATWEQDVGRLLQTNVRPGMTAVDVGANVGFHTATLARLVGPAGVVHAFEPLTTTLDILRANLWRHGYVNTLVHPVAVSDQPGLVLMEPDAEGRSGAHLASTGVAVEAVRLDDMLPGVVVDLLKVDVEGAEPLVFRGAAGLVEASPNLIAIVEFRATEHLDGSSPDQVLDLYESLGLKLNLLTPDGRAVPAERTAVLREAARCETVNLVLRKRPAAPPRP